MRNNVDKRSSPIEERSTVLCLHTAELIFQLHNLLSIDMLFRTKHAAVAKHLYSMSSMTLSVNLEQIVDWFNHQSQ